MPPFATDSYHGHHGFAQAQSFRDPIAEQEAASTSCQEIIQNQVKILYEYEALLNQKRVPDHMYQGIFERLETNHLLIYQALESYSKKPFFKKLSMSLEVAMQKYSKCFKHRDAYQLFKGFRKDVLQRKKPNLKEIKGARRDEASMNYTTMQIAQGQNKFDARGGKKSEFNPEAEMKEAALKIDDELHRLKHGIPSKYQGFRGAYPYHRELR